MQESCWISVLSGHSHTPTYTAHIPHTVSSMLFNYISLRWVFLLPAAFSSSPLQRAREEKGKRGRMKQKLW